jgi:AcrR family transcriptional regulator
MSSTEERLRRGPAGPDAAARIRERVLDAAADVLLSEGLHRRLHAVIAERAGVSRPTVYKYVGDQQAIHRAVLERELDRFFGAALPVLRTSDDLEAHLVDAVVIVVEYARGHALLQKALRDHPELVLPALTTESAALVERVVDLFGDQLGRALDRAGVDDLTPRAAAEWLYRVVVSLVTTPTPATADAEGLRRSVADLIRLMRIAGPEAGAPGQ